MGLKTAFLAALALGSGSVAAGSEMTTPGSYSSSDFPPISDVVISDNYWTNKVEKESFEGAATYAHLLPLIPPARNQGTAWRIYHKEWSEAHERGYESFVQAIGRSGCISIDDCLRSPANPFRDLEDDTLWLGDCTDMVYVLRGYYAWKMGLPFSFQAAVSINPGKDAGNDSRYSKYGNRVTSRTDIIHPQGRAPRNAPDFLTGIFNIVSTAMLRVNAEQDGRLFTDFYPLEITREAVRPGTVVYDIYGHVSIVYEIEDDGRILMISSHPDYTVSREPFGQSVVRSGPELGSGILAWRPIKLKGARRTSDGNYIGGRIVGTSNEKLTDFSLEQYWGTHPDESGRWDMAKFESDDRVLGYYDFVRARLRKPGTPFDPVDEMARATDALCTSFLARKTAVNLAIYAGIHEQAAPDRLPDNIYGTYGDWERYATPSRDARLRTQAIEVDQLARDLIARHEAGDPSIDFPIGNLPAALHDVYDRRATTCRINYKRTDGSIVRLNMHHALDRLFDLSFDPFHCPERRWGASGNELSTCTDGKEKAAWYDAQRFLRNDPRRTYDLKTDFTAEELKDPAKYPPEKGGIGRPLPPSITFPSFLLSEAEEHTLSSAELPAKILKNSSAVNEAADRQEYRKPRRYHRQRH